MGAHRIGRGDAHALGQFLEGGAEAMRLDVFRNQVVPFRLTSV